MATTSPTTGVMAASDTPSVAARWYVLIVMMLVYAINIADRYVMSTVLEPIRLELKLSDGGIAFLTGVSLALFYVTLGIPLSWVADRYNRRNLLAASILAWSAMTALCGLSRGYWHLLLARIGVGVGEAGGTPASNSIVADYFPAERRPMAMAVFALGAPIGAWLGADMAGAVANSYGWRAAFLALGVPGVMIAAIVYFTVREPVRGRLDECVDNTTPTIAETLRFLWTQKAAFHIVMGGGVSALWGWGLMWFTPTFLQRSFNLSVGEAGAVVGPIHLIAGVAASLFTAWLLARPAFVDPRRIVWLLAGVTAVATVPSFIVYWTASLSTAKIMLWIFIPAIYFYIGPAMALIQNLSPCRMRAMFIAISLLSANVLNLIVAPQGVGLLSDYFAGPGGADAASLRQALLFLAPTGFWAAWHYWMAGKTIIEDQKRLAGMR